MAHSRTADLPTGEISLYVLMKRLQHQEKQLRLNELHGKKKINKMKNYKLIKKRYRRVIFGFHQE